MVIKSQATSLDVARLAGVSQSAVSRVFTPGASYSTATAEKVRTAARTLGYAPNRLARSLITGKSRIIGLVVAYLNNQFYPDALERLSRALEEQGYHVLIFMAANQEDDLHRVMDQLLSYQVEGLILASVGLTSDLADRCEAAGIPVVLFNRTQENRAGFAATAITSANVKGGEKATEHLIALGHEKIAHISGWLDSSTGQDRAKGYRIALERHGLRPFAELDGGFDRERAAEAARRIFAGAKRPTALFVGNDHMASAVMDVLRYELGLSIPHDVSVVGYDDVAMAAWPSYDLTTVRQPARQMVAATVEQLLARICEPDTRPKLIEIDGPLIVRGSTKKREV